MLEQDARHCLIGWVVKFVRFEEKERRRRARLLVLSRSLSNCPIVCSRRKVAPFAVNRPGVERGAALAISIMRRNCVVICGPPALENVHANYVTYVTAESDLAPFWMRLPTRCLRGFEDRKAPKRSSLDTQLSVGTKGGISFYSICSLVCFCD